MKYMYSNNNTFMSRTSSLNVSISKVEERSQDHQQWTHTYHIPKPPFRVDNRGGGRENRTPSPHSHDLEKFDLEEGDFELRWDAREFGGVIKVRGARCCEYPPLFFLPCISRSYSIIKETRKFGGGDFVKPGKHDN